MGRSFVDKVALVRTLSTFIVRKSASLWSWMVRHTSGKERRIMTKGGRDIWKSEAFGSFDSKTRRCETTLKQCWRLFGRRFTMIVLNDHPVCAVLTFDAQPPLLS